jgi:hypothetical protein
MGYATSVTAELQRRLLCADGGERGRTVLVSVEGKLAALVACGDP